MSLSLQNLKKKLDDDLKNNPEKKMIQIKDVSVLLEGWDEKMKRFFRYIGAQFIRGEGDKSIWNCFIPLPKLTATLTSSCKSFQVILEKWSSQHRDPSHSFPSLDKGHAAFRVGKRSTVCVYVCMLRVGGEKGVQTGTK